MRRFLQSCLRGIRKPDAVLSDAPRPPYLEDEAAYRAFLASVLDGQSDEVLRKLHAAVDRLPQKARGLHIVVHLGQEEDGSFWVQMHVVGPDLHVLNDAIKGYANLFEGRASTIETAIANVPQFDPFNVPFDVSAAIAEESSSWMEHVWCRASLPDLSVPVCLVSDDGYGGAVILARDLSRIGAAHAH